MERHDLTVIGGGPVGLYGAAMAGMHGMRTMLIESLPELGGQLYALYPEKYVYDVAGFPQILAKDLVESLKAQTMVYQPTVCLGEAVIGLETLGGGGYRLVTTRGIHETRAVIIAAGIGRFQPRRLMVSGADGLEGKGLYYFVPHLDELANRRVLIVGGGDSAVDWALAVADRAEEVVLIHRRGAFRAQEESVHRMREHARIRIKLFYELRGVIGAERVEGAVIFDNRTGEEERLNVNAIIGALGFQPDLGPIRDWGLELNHNAIRVSSAMETNRAGIFAAGDVVTYPGKVPLIATGFGEVATAVGSARAHLDPSGKGGLPHSSTLRPGQG